MSMSENDSHAEMHYQALLNVSEEQRSNFISTMVSQCTNLVVSSGGKITGNGLFRSVETGNIANVENRTCNVEDRTFEYESGKTEGSILLLTTAVDKSRLQIRVIIFECKRQW